MALWKTWTKADGTLGLLHKATGSGAEFLCGDMRATTESLAIVRWIVIQGDAKPWDIISLHTGRTLVVMSTGAQA